MKHRLSTFFIFGALIFLTACGGSPAPVETPKQPLPTPKPIKKETPAGPITLKSAELTTAVNQSQLTADAPASTEFLPETNQIFLVATFENLTQKNNLEIRWMKDSSSNPLYVDKQTGSDKPTIISRLRAPGNAFLIGKYQAVISVDNEYVGTAGFKIATSRDGGQMRVKSLKVASALESETQKAINPTTSFRKKIKKVYASFFVGGLGTGGTIRILWYKEDNLIKEDDIESQGEKRYTSVLEKNKGLANGNYKVEIELDGEVFSARSFYVGDSAAGPDIDEAGLSLGLKKNNRPKKIRTSFNRNARTIYCSISFVSLKANSKIQVLWTSLLDGEENILQTSETTLATKGDATIGMAWNTGKKIKVGNYKAIIMLNDTKMKELPFTIK